MNFEEACRILGIPTTATAEEIHAQYIYKAQLLHPDKTVNLPDKVRHKAEEELKRINEAYNILKNIETSPSGIAPKLSVEPQSIIFKDLAPGEKQTALIRVDNTGGAFTRFWADDSPAPWLKVRQVRSTTANPLPLEITLEATAISTLETKNRCSLLILLENSSNNTHDQVEVTIDIQPAHKNQAFPLKIFGPVLKNPFNRGKPKQVTAEKAWMPWLKTALSVLAGYLAGLVILRISEIGFSVPLTTGAAALFAIDKWHRQLTTRFKPAGALYKLVLNLAMLTLAGLIIWSAAQIFRLSLPSDYLSYVFILVVELVIFVYLARVLSENSWRRPKLVPTFFLLVLIAIGLAFAEVEPLASCKDSVIEFLSSVYTRAREWMGL
ncbi:MAG: J domain-containing protein [Dehalococcoidales bacterium]|jgi:hypothetical protein|nr:J domain-containing protein [Dehalococcoidales bacterium]MDD3264549.1 J domain-containing protein [Dehalococcoidales bacterium]MDD4322391.1 J domain-containing protein [Dehalococcoidales bacterium]MDD4794011.1 J domain-containing protein [Dehalococcoidales bacterium]MDD5498414.1 J domain-containing protein [Dehalococcoidales bacterium]